ncbi:hypothetical protein SAMN05216553_106333 [Lentzea fradiae]|uniref:Uncharacterized protein n=1 Tax=Lentzea fradiae TaxID=200378 RepID=A0A1G7SLP3_9PSEU|nr:hypothetical protein [Lentzea fradiae]SDG23933.1 hypothetical protein SAMN05216553_106333 [Lentzea fradiae]
MEAARKPALALAVASVLILVAAADLAAVLLWQPASRSLLHDVLVVFWPLPAFAGFLLGTYELFLHKRLVTELGRVSGPGIVEHLLPSEVLRAFLSSLYGQNEANNDVIAGVLGGDGLSPRKDDLTISTDTTVKLELQGIDAKTYHLRTTQRYRFRHDVPTDRFVIFATSNATLRDTISAACRHPLFELYFIPDPALFLESVDDLRHSTRIAIDYLDHEGQPRSAEPSQIPPVEVRFDRWSNYLTFFREATGPLGKLSPLDHTSDLRILECDLSDIAEDHVVRAVRGLTVWSRTLQRTNDGFCYWQSPYPSFVDTIGLDARALEVEESPRYEFRVMPFTFRSATAAARWLEAGELGDLDVRSWLLPGHGVALLWREATT